MILSQKRSCSGCWALAPGAPAYCELGVPIMRAIPKYPEPLDSTQFEPVGPCYKPKSLADYDAAKKNLDLDQPGNSR